MVCRFFNNEGKGTIDVLSSLRKISLPIYLARSDIRQRYRRSVLGPFWITISTGVMIATIGIIFGTLFKSPMNEFLPFLTIGVVIWGYISTAIGEGTNVFCRLRGNNQTIANPLFSHVIRLIARNFIIFLHNLVIYPIVCLCVGKSIGICALLSIPGFF